VRGALGPGRSRLAAVSCPFVLAGLALQQPPSPVPSYLPPLAPIHPPTIHPPCSPAPPRSAFKALAYKKYHHVPIYLEWAPRDVWDAAAAAAAATKGAAARQKAAAAATEAAAAAADAVAEAGGAVAAAGGGKEEEDAGGDGPTGSIYVKNLNFATTDAGLRKHFDRAASAAGARVLSAKVARRKGADGKSLSLGFGFVELDGPDAAKAVTKALQGSMLDKHKLQLQLSKGRPGGGGGGGGDGESGAKKKGGKRGKGEEGGTKLLVRNLAFEATRKDIVGLFGPFGHIKSARLPKKFDGNHRGFAFVEFVTKQEAANALEGVGGTHLYGRRLVVEYAAQGEEGLDELRAKAAAKFAGGEAEEAAAPAKRLKRTL
jgi:multiple RNA-binding domain-containing protein 1